MKPKITVIMAVRNMADTLWGALMSVQNQDYPKGDFEFILVDDRSDDPKTLELISRFKKETDLNFRLIRRDVGVEGAGPGIARNEGIAVAQAEVIAFTDADCVLDDNWLKAVDRELVQGDAVVLSGETWTDQVCVFPWKMAPAGQANITANLAFRRGYVDDERFSEKFQGYLCEDTDFVSRFRKIGHQPKRCPDMRVFHPVRVMTVGHIIRRARWRANEVLLHRRYPESALASLHPIFQPRLFGRLSWATTAFLVGLAVLVWAAVAGPQYLILLAVAVALAAAWFLSDGYRLCVMYVPPGQKETDLSLKERAYTLLTAAIYLPTFVAMRLYGSISFRHFLM